ncbi:MAG: S-layer homology domain-containing protein [Bacillota bacterium]
MKSLRKVLVAAIVAAMVFGTVGSAFASVRAPSAVFSDVAGHAQESFILQTASLGIFAGYPDGTYKPDQEVTRAEFAKVLVVMLGLESAAKILEGNPTTFPDVPASHWASGYINVATAMGIIRGFPDGTFGPSNTILASQAVTMIVRALGYSAMAEATATWPLGEILTATNMSVNADGTARKSILPANFSANKLSTRGDVAQLVSNALTVNFCTGRSAATNAWTFDTAKLLNKLGTTPMAAAVEGTVTAVTTSSAGVTSLTIGGENFEVASNAILKGVPKLADLRDRIIAYTQKSGKIVFIDVLPKTVVIKGAYTAYTAPSGTLGNRVTVGGVVYELAASPIIRVNGLVTNPGTSAAYVIGDVNTTAFLAQKPEATLILDANGKVATMNIFVFNVTGYIAGKKTEVTSTGSVVNKITVGGTEYTIVSAAEITRNGATATFAQLAFNDNVKLAITPGTTNVANVDAFFLKTEGYMTTATYDGNSGIGTIILDGVQAVNPPAPATPPVGFSYRRISYSISAAGVLVDDSATTPTLTYYNADVTSLKIGDHLAITFNRDGKIDTVVATQRKVTGFLTAKATTTTTTPHRFYYTIDGVQYEAAAGATYALGGASKTDATFYAEVKVGDAISAALDQTGKLLFVTAFTTVTGSVGTDLTSTSTSISVGGTTYTFATGVTFFRGGTQVARETIKAGEQVKLTLDSTGKVTQVVVTGVEYLTVANKSVYIKTDGSVAKAITFTDGTSLEIPGTVVFTLNGAGFGAPAHDNGFAAVRQNDAAKVTYDLDGKPTNVDLYRTMSATITTITGNNVTYTVASPPTGWTPAVVSIVPSTETGATSIVYNGRTTAFGTVLEGSTATLSFNATTGKLSSIVAKKFTVDGVVTGKSVVYGATGTATVTLTVALTGGGTTTVDFASGAIVIKNGAASTVDNILINDKIKADQTTATYVEVTTP